MTNQFRIEAVSNDQLQICLNGKFVSAHEPLLMANERGFLLGDGLFETIKAVNGKLLFFGRHYQRLQHSAAILGIPLPVSEEELREQCLQLMDCNQLLKCTAALRVTLTRGQAQRGISLPEICQPTLLVTAVQYEDVKKTPSVCVTNIRRNEFSPLTRLKTLNYLESILARKFANERGFDEGIMLNTQGRITESSIANVFLMLNEELVTPSLKEGVLPGVLRQVILECCQRAGIECQQRAVTVEEALAASVGFQTNSLVEVQFFSRIEGRELKRGVEEIRLRRLLEIYEECREAEELRF